MSRDRTGEPESPGPTRSERGRARESLKDFGLSDSHVSRLSKKRLQIELQKVKTSTVFGLLGKSRNYPENRFGAYRENAKILVKHS